VKSCPALLLCLLSAFVTPARAENDAAAAPAPAPEWEFSLTTFLWATSLEGTLNTEDVSADIDVAFSDIWNALDVGVLANLEARRGKLSITSNLIYLKLSADAENPVNSLLPAAPPGSFGVRSVIQTGIFELRPAWEVLSLPVFGAGDARRVALDLGPQARVFWLDQHLSVKLEPGAPLGPFSQRFDGSTDWVDFLVAGRVRAQLTGKLGFVLFGDYGGFDIGSSSHRTWSLGGFFSYPLGERWALAGGWRTLEIDRGSVDLEMAGPLVGAVYRF
jgi:hypothetical protein